MQPQQQSFDSFGRWMLTRLRADLAPCPAHPTPALLRFFNRLYEDMTAEPAAYAIPYEPFVTFFARVTRTPEEDRQHEVLKAARLRVRKGVYAYLEFLYQLGQAGESAAADLQLPRAEFERLINFYAKKVKGRGFLAALERCGLGFSSGDPVLLTNRHYPGMPAALGEFSKACAQVKDFDFYHFRRCDLAVFAGKTGPDFGDALRMVPQAFQAEVAETDERLGQLRFKREIFIDGGDMTYRLRYSLKGEQAVYWCRIQETFHADLGHYLRWKLDSDLTPRLFASLEERQSGLAERVFAGLKACQHCYGGSCMDRVLVKWQGEVKETCKGSGWNQIGHEPGDYEELWMVLAALREIA